MKKYFSILACALLACACTQKAGPENEDESYAGNKAKVEMSSSEPIPAEGGTLTVNIVDSPEFRASLPKTADWLKCTQSGSTLSLSASANTSAVLRVAHISIIDSELDISITSFDIVQAGTDKDIERKAFRVSTDAIAVKASDTAASFSVISEVAWTVSCDNPAFTASPASGSGDADISIAFPANTATEVVTAGITVETTDEAANPKKYVITLTQEAFKEQKPAEKPAPGTVLAEWFFNDDQFDALCVGGFQQSSSSPEVDAPGNMGGAYVPSNVSGNGKLEYYNGVDKSTVKTKNCVKRDIGTRGEPVVYGTWVGDWFTWTAETDAPLAAGTKFKLNFVLRPNTGGSMKYWKAEYLDGDQWVELETIELEYHANAADTPEDPKQINCYIEETATLTKDTPYAQFRFTCTQNAQCGDGTPLAALSENHVFRFAGFWSSASSANQHLRVLENPMIIVVE